jgi:lipoate-protein ligase B
MIFLHPEYLWLLLLLIPLIVWYIVRLSKMQASFKLASVNAFKGVKPGLKVYMRHLPFVLRVISIGLIILVIARPQSVNSWEESESQGIDIVLALDVSGSMLSQDLQPDRLQAAKKVASEFVTDRRNDNIGLVVFAGESFTQCPLTTDHTVLLNLCESRNIDLHEIDRGGDITYHGPGQLVVYPIIDLEEYGIGIKKYISMLEDVVIKTLKHLGLEGDKDEKAMGVWIDSKDPVKARKICAIGVRVSRFVTMHGLALNVNTDLSYFDYINPCGFTDRGVTSIEKEVNRKIDMNDVSERMKEAFAEVFGMTY